MSKKKKTSKLSGWIATAFCFVIGGFCGFLIIDIIENAGFNTDSAPEFFAFLVLLFVMTYLIVFLQIAIHEGGHLIFGLFSGYEFSSYRIGSLLWMKEDGKLKLKKYTLAGTGGQCLMRPPKMIDGQVPVVLYNLGGSIMNLVMGVLFLLLAVATKQEQPLVYCFSLLMSLIGIVFAFLNGIPMNTGLISNDGENARSLGKNKSAMRAWWIQLEMNHLLTSGGVSLKNMNKDWFTPVSEEDMKNSLTASLAVFRCNRLMEEMKFSQAMEEMEAIVSGENAVAGLYKSLIKNDMIFCELLDGCDSAKLEALLNKEQKNFEKAMKSYPSILRTQYTYALIFERNQQKADEIKTKFEKMAKDYPYQTEIDNERKYMELAEKIAGKKLSRRTFVRDLEFLRETCACGILTYKAAKKIYVWESLGEEENEGHRTHRQSVHHER